MSWLREADSRSKYPIDKFDTLRPFVTLSTTLQLRKFANNVNSALTSGLLERESSGFPDERRSSASPTRRGADGNRHH
ncbi:MAG TPA: hypothetical protein VFY94_13255, partial [Rhodanobacteraceae bacterium]|nr:hypothetical protein [Rhodanobacteraceae bacterium]